MNLSAKLVATRLKKHFPELTTSQFLSAEPCLKYPVLYQSNRSLREGLIYLIDDPDFELYETSLSKVMLIFTRHAKPEKLRRFQNVLILPDASTPLVFQYLQEIFEIYNDWNQTMLETMFSASDVQHLLEISSEAIPNPMAVITMDFQILATVGTQLYGEKGSILGSSEDSRALVTVLKYDTNYQAVADYTGFFYYPGNAMADPSIGVNIRLQGKTQCRLLIVAGELPLDDTIGFLAEFLAANITNIITASPSEGLYLARSRRTIFQTLLTNPKADYVEISHSLSASGWEVSHMYQCIVIIPGSQDIVNMTLNSVCSYIENNFPESCTIQHMGRIVVYINLTLSSISLDDIRRKLAFYIRDSLLRAGYSRSLMGHFNFYRQYQQAMTAIELGEKKNPTRWVHQFNDIAMEYLKTRMVGKLPAYMICHERLLSLKYHDESNGTEYFLTLKAFLQNNQSPTRTADALFIHRSTLLYRMEHIKKLLRSELNDPEELLYLMISYHLLEDA